MNKEISSYSEKIPERPKGPERTAIFDGLLALNGEKASGTISDIIIKRPQIKGVFIFGEPGVGKTSVATELMDSLRQRVGENLQMTLIQYDQVLSEVFERLGVKNLPRESIVSNELLQRIQDEMAQEHTDSNIRRLIIIEAPSIGRRIKDRAVSTFESLAKKSKTQTFKECDMFFIAIVPNPRIQEEAKKLRDKIISPETEDKDVLEVMKQHNILVEGFPPSTDGKTKGKLIKGLFAKMASSKKIESIQREVLSQANIATQAGVGFKILKDIPLPKNIIPEGERRTIKEMHRFRVKAAHLHKTLTDHSLSHGFTPKDAIRSKGMVVVSKYSNEPIYWNLRSILSFEGEDSVEAQPGNKPTRIFLVRHGEPKVYGRSRSGLSDRGKIQMREVAKNIANLLKEGEEEQVVKVLYSKRRRTFESAMIINDELNKLIQKERLQNTDLEPPEKEERLQTADSLDALTQRGVEKGKALEIWLNLPTESLETINCKTPEEIQSSMFSWFKILQKIPDTGKNQQINYVMITHETTLAALQRFFSPNNIVFPKFAEVMEIELGESPDEFRVKYKGEEATRKLPAE